jgi:hypothetical protein
LKLSASASRYLGAKVFGQLAELPAVLTLPDRIPWSRLCYASGIVDLDENPQTIKREAALGKEIFKHD